MVNYILINYGKFPEYTSSVVDSILISEKNPNIFLCSDESINHLEINKNKVKYINLNEVQTDRTRDVINLNYYKNLDNRLWKTSLWRIFAISDVIKHLDVSSFIHFDNDVLIYHPHTSFIKDIDLRRIYMTKLNDTSFVLSYMYCGDVDIYEKFIQKLYKHISTEKFLKRVNKKKNIYKYNEMNLINIINKKFNYIETLPTIPSSDVDYIFDPADYGFLIDGHFYEDGVSNIYADNFVGKFLLTNKPDLIFKDQKPKLTYKNKDYDIVNLHIHSKNLRKFLVNPIPPVIK